MIAGTVPEAVTVQVRALADLDLVQLREVWRVHLGAPPKLRSVDLLRRLLAWRLQADAAGGLQPDAKAALKRRAAAARGPTLVAGGVVAREWRGERHEAEILADGVLYAGARYASLSEVARPITGARWNGPRFFGLRSEA